MDLITGEKGLELLSMGVGSGDLGFVYELIRGKSREDHFGMHGVENYR